MNRYVLVYFLKGSLPWQGLKARNAKRKYNMILERKQAISIQQLCQGLPQQFAEYLAYCRSLKFDAKPNIPYLQGLLRELYKAQGHSTTGPMDWDWSKFDALVESNSECSSGDVGAVEATADTVQGCVAASTTAEGVTSRTQVAITDGKGQLPQATFSETPACDVRGSGALPARKITAANTDEEPCADDVGGRHVGEVEDAMKTVVISMAAGCGSGQPVEVGGPSRPEIEGQNTLQGASAWSKWNLRTKTSAAFWAGATRSWSARDSSSGQSRTVPVAGMRAITKTTARGSPLRESPDRLATDDAKKGEGGTRNANQRAKATNTKTASVDVTRTVRPHTAHGNRATDIGGEVSASQGAFGEGGEAAPVVAGARGMIRYRNERSGSAASGGISTRGCHSWFGGGSDGSGVRGSGKGTQRGHRPATGSAKESIHQRGRQLSGAQLEAWRRAASASGLRNHARHDTYGAKGVKTTGRPGAPGNVVDGMAARASRSSYTVHGRQGSSFGTGAESATVGVGRQRPLSARSRGLGVPSPAFVHPPSYFADRAYF
ncbi:unnamed protein product [Ectocarpus sp. 13 AM-2016]